MKIKNDKLFSILKKIQEYQNKYIDYKKRDDPLNMIKIMWEIGDFLFKNEIKNPHSLGWEAERQRAFIKRPLVFRSFVIRRIWGDKEKLEKDLYGIKSTNSLIEFFPFLDQNDKWKVPQNEMENLFKILNTKSAKIFNLELKKIKEKYIGIKNDREKYLSDYNNLKHFFYEFFNKFKKVISEDPIEECMNFLNRIGKENLINFGKLCLYIAAKKEVNKNLLNKTKSKDKQFNDLTILFGEKIKTKEDINRIRRVIDPIDLIKVTDFCNSIQNEEGIRSYRIREGLKINFT